MQGLKGHLTYYILSPLIDGENNVSGLPTQWSEFQKALGTCFARERTLLLNTDRGIQNILIIFKNVPLNYGGIPEKAHSQFRGFFFFNLGENSPSSGLETVPLALCLFYYC